MAKVLKGNVVANKIKERIKNEIEELHTKDIYPCLGIVRLGSDPSDVSYEKSIIRNCDSLNIKTKLIEKARDISTEELVSIIEDLNNDKSISGILIFNPLPKQIDIDIIKDTIDPLKDVDSMNPVNLQHIFEGNMSGFVPGTPKAVMEILSYYDIDLEGKNVVVINRSMVVGKPLSMMLLEENATVTICHSRTKELDKITRNADIVVTALGNPKFFDKKYFNEDSIVIDVGVSVDEDGKISGDLDYDNLLDHVSMITPVPGGVGSVTTSLLLSHVVKGAK